MSRHALCIAVLLTTIAGGVVPSAASAAGRYVAIGDSIAGADDSYVERLAARLGISDVHPLISGDTAAQAVRSQLPAAQALISDGTDTTVVTVQLGGHDHLTGNCAAGWNLPGCDFADGLSSVLGGLREALATDPGVERFVVVAYHNPASGQGGAQERDFDRGLRGTDGRLDAGAHGDAWGMTDVIGWLACRHGAALADPWAAFKAGGQALLADPLHPNATGQEILTGIIAAPATGGPAPTCPASTPFATTEPEAGDGSMHGIVEPRLASARWWFEYGPSTAYGASTPARVLAPSAGARAVAARLPAELRGDDVHVRLVTENDRGRFAGEDRLLTVPDVPELSATASRHRSRRALLRRGLPVRVSSTGTRVTAEGRLSRRGPDPLVIARRMTWRAGEARTFRLRLTRRGRRLMGTASVPARLRLFLVADGPGGASAPARLTVRVR